MCKTPAAREEEHDTGSAREIRQCGEEEEGFFSAFYIGAVLHLAGRVPLGKSYEDGEENHSSGSTRWWQFDRQREEEQEIRGRHHERKRVEEAYDNASNEEDEEACSDAYKEDYDKATYYFGDVEGIVPNPCYSGKVRREVLGGESGGNANSGVVPVHIQGGKGH